MSFDIERLSTNLCDCLNHPKGLLSRENIYSYLYFNGISKKNKSQNVDSNKANRRPEGDRSPVCKLNYMDFSRTVNVTPNGLR